MSLPHHNPQASGRKPQAPGTPFRMLLRARGWAVRNALQQVWRENRFKALTVAVLGGGFWVGLFALFLHSFHFLQTTLKGAADQLLLPVFALFFLTLLVMLIFSNAIISFGALFKTGETAYLIASPIHHETVFHYKLIESLLFSSWAFLALGAPLMLAYGIIYDAHWWYYPAILLFFIPFVIIPASLGALIALLLMTFLPRQRKRVLGIGIFIVVLAGLLFASHAIDQGGLWTGSTSDFDQIIAKLQFSQNPYLPNSWITRGLLAAAAGDGNLTLLFLGALCATAFFTVNLAGALAYRLYPRAYNRSQSASRRRVYHRASLLESAARRLRSRNSIVPLLMVKDVKNFLRDPVQWSQVVIFFGVLLIYIVNLKRFPYNFNDPFYKNLISFLNLTATCLTLATLFTRFVFPLLSLEGQKFWILGLLPIDRSRLLVGKFLFAFFGGLIVTEFLVILSSYMLRTGPATDQDIRLLALHVYAAALICFGLTGLSVGMGALFPTFGEPNPSKIVSGFGGTLTLVLSVSYVLVTVIVLAVPCHLHFAAQAFEHEGFRNWILAAVAGAVVLSLTAGLVPMMLGARAFKRLEF